MSDPASVTSGEFDYQLALIRLEGTPITELQRMVCYNQTIYDDIRLEEDEFIGLSLLPLDISLNTDVAVPYHFAAINITDNDRKRDRANNTDCLWPRSSYI